MAVYGITSTPGTVPFTGYTPTLGVGAANVDAASGAVQFNGITQGDFYIQQPLGLGGKVAAIKALLNSLLGQAVGVATSVNKLQVQQVQGAPGGLIPIETVSLINRATTTADKTALQQLFSRQNGPATYPADLSGNGGGGKQLANGIAY